jgi:hypothetical protein
MPEIIGVTFPIPKPFIQRFFVEGKTVFIKPATIYKELRPGMKFVFYQSREDTGYIGEAIIKKITLAEDPFYLLKIYINDVYLTEKELRDYVKLNEKWKKRTKKKYETKKGKWLAIELGSIRRYDTPIKPEHFIPISGKYLKRDD